MPPSPRLSARMTNPRYLNVTTKVIAQKTSERTPSTLSGVGGTPCGPVKHSFSAYSGLVPMSPKTTPSAVSDRTASARPRGAAGMARCTPVASVVAASAAEPGEMSG